jgi:hypothetical protein
MTTTPIKVWTKVLGSVGTDWANALATGPDGSVYLGGYTNDAFDGQTTISNGDGEPFIYDGFLTKFNPDGTKAWTTLVGTRSMDWVLGAVTGLDGSIYLTGNTYGSLDGVTNTQTNSSDAFLIKINPDGSQAWARHIGSRTTETGNAISIDKVGSIYVAGHTTSSFDGQEYAGGTDAYLTKYNADGVKLWTRFISSNSYEVATTVSSAVDGSIYVAGNTTGSIDGQKNNGEYDVFLAKFDSAGTKIWTKLIGSSRDDRTSAIGTGSDGSIYLAGQTTGSFDGYVNDGSMGMVDSFVTKYSASGSKLWTQFQGGTGLDRPFALKVAPDDSVYVSGDTSSSKFELQTVNGSSDVFVTKYSLEGIKEWTTVIGSNTEDMSSALTIGLDGSLYVSGITYGTFDAQSNLGSGDAFLVKFDFPKTSATYTVSAASFSINEGSSASFDITTTLPTGSVISYTLTGISSSDISSSLFGTAIIDVRRKATVTIPIANDLTTEGTEKLTLSVQGVSASIFINDSSTSPNSSVTSVPYGNGQFYYATSSADKVNGTAFVDIIKEPTPYSSTKVSRISDGSWQVQNKLMPADIDSLLNIERIEFNDLSVALDVLGAAGQVAKILGSVFGPSYVKNTAFAGIGLAYLDAGMSYLDLCALAAAAAGLSSPDLLISTLLKNSTGIEASPQNKAAYLQAISNGASYASVVQQIADSSVNAQSIKLTDIVNTGLAYIPYVLPPTYALSTSTTSINEGVVAQVYVSTTNVATGTRLQFDIGGVGITPSDVIGGLSGFVNVDTTGKAVININIAADQLTEGPETMYITMGTLNTNLIINDTSVTLVGMIDNGGGDGGGGGGGAGGGD